MTSWNTQIAFFLIPLVILIGVYWFRRKSEMNASLQMGSTSALKSIARGWRAKFSDVPTYLKLISAICIIVALARPQESTTQIKRNVEGIDIMIAFDISDSMLIEDMLPENRLESAKQTIAEFIAGRVSDRIGLVVFSGESYTRVPLTLDYPLLLNNLKEVKTSRNIKMGTAIGVALANAVARLKDSKAKSRVIIFMTDGENNSGTIAPETALDIAVGYGVKIYSIGMGKDGQAQLPVYIQDAFGNTIKQYRPMHSQVNEPLLTKFATSTGGKFWRASTTSGLADVFHQIDGLEKTKIDVDKFTRYAELYQPWLFAAILFYILSLVLSQTVFRRGP
jgi:Ca-activated chloride channel family protein